MGLESPGVAESIEKAKQMTQKLMKIDNNYDIYTVEVGKFFPLTVEPHEVGEMEYENEQLNTLIKSYLANREAANEQWHQRKAEMIKEAIREGKNQEEMSSKPEHPIAVLQRIKTFEDKINELKDEINMVSQDLELARDKYSKYSDEERSTSDAELKSVVHQVTEEKAEGVMSLEEIRKQLIDDLSTPTPHTDSDEKIKEIMSNIDTNEQELQELINMRRSIDQLTSPNIYKRVNQQITELESNLAELKAKMNDSQQVNNFINSNYSGSQYNYLDNAGPSRYRE
jgi:hypothetical protein